MAKKGDGFLKLGILGLFVVVFVAPAAVVVNNSYKYGDFYEDLAFCWIGLGGALLFVVMGLTARWNVINWWGWLHLKEAEKELKNGGSKCRRHAKPPRTPGHLPCDICGELRHYTDLIQVCAHCLEAAKMRRTD